MVNLIKYAFNKMIFFWWSDPKTEKEWEASTTASPGSCWHTWNQTTFASPAPTTLDDDETPKLDYWNLSRDETLGMDGEGQPCCLDEVERARNHPDFSSFIKWLHKSYYGLDQVEDYVWGDAEGDPLADMQDFAMWLVETGQGSWEADESVTYLGETPMPPDNQLGDSELYPNGPETTRAVIDNTHGFCQTEVVGTVSFSKTWQKDLEQVMVSNPDWWNCSVLGGGFLIDFVGQNELKFTPARNQFPLEVRRAIYDFEELESETEGDEPMGDHDLKDPMGDHDLKEGDHDLKDPMGDHDLMEGDHDLKDPMWDHDLQSHDLKDHVETHTGEPTLVILRGVTLRGQVMLGATTMGGTLERTWKDMNKRISPTNWKPSWTRQFVPWMKEWTLVLIPCKSYFSLLDNVSQTPW